MPASARRTRALLLALLAGAACGGVGGGGAAAAVVPNDGKGCPADYFACMDGNGCVPLSVRCDATNDCADGTDEYACEGEAESAAVPALVAAAAEAAGASKEESADAGAEGTERVAEDGGCALDEHRCLDGTCISRARLCDGPRDCFDGSDEQEAAGCVPLTNATASVEAASGEWRGASRCTSDEFQCGDGTCVPQSATCDEHRDCPDGSDELLACPTRVGDCHEDFRCGDGRCVPVEWVCNGDVDCADSSDEAPALCATWRAPQPHPPPPPYMPLEDAQIQRISGDACEHMDPVERQHCWNDQLHKLKVSELEERQRAAHEQLQAARMESEASKQLHAEQLEAAQLQRRAAEELLQQQRELHHLRLLALQSNASGPGLGPATDPNAA